MRRKTQTRRKQARHACLSHPGHRGIRPAHGRARPCDAIDDSPRKFLAHRPRIAPGSKNIPQNIAVMRAEKPNKGGPIQGPALGLNEASGLAKREVKASQPWAWPMQEMLKIQ
jgi:hypothetical protein